MNSPPAPAWSRPQAWRAARRAWPLTLVSAAVIGAWAWQAAQLPTNGSLRIAEPEATAVAASGEAASSSAAVTASQWFSVGSPTLLRTAELLGPRLVSLDPIERAVALREWEAALSMPVRWGAGSDWASVPESLKPRLLSGQAIELDQPRRVFLIVPREGQAASDGDLLVVGPFLKRRAEGDLAALASTVDSHSSASPAQAMAPTTLRATSWPAAAAVLGGVLFGAVAVTAWSRQRRRGVRMRGPLAHGTGVTDVAEVVQRLDGPATPALGMTPMPTAEPVVNNASLAARLLDPQVQSAERSLRMAEPMAERSHQRVGTAGDAEAASIAGTLPDPIAQPTAQPTAHPAAAPLTHPLGTAHEEPPVEQVLGLAPSASAPAATAPGRAAPFPVAARVEAVSPLPWTARARSAERPPQPAPFLDGPVLLGPAVTVPAAPHRLGTLLREQPVEPAVAEVGDLAALLRSEVERVRRQFGEAKGGEAKGTESAGAANTLVIDFDPWLDGPVAHQPALMRRAVRNLLKAAAERASRHVVLSARIEGGTEVVIEVDDDGLIAMDEDESMTGDRGVSSTSGRSVDVAANDDGGLAFVSSVAQWHGGRTGMERSPLGGVRCLLRWPAKVDAGPGQGPPAAAGAGAAVSPRPAPGPDRRQKPLGR